MALDFSEVSELVTKVEWLNYELNGIGDKEGLLTKLDRMIATIEGAEAPESYGLITKVEKLTADIQMVLDQQSKLAAVILRPVQESHQKSILDAVDQGFQDGRKQLQEEMADCVNGSHLAAERIVKATAQAEFVFRSQQESLTTTKDDLNRSSGQVAQQLRQMLSEMKTAINEETLQEPLRVALEKTLASSSLEVNKTQLTESWKLILEDLVIQFRNEMLQHREGIEDIFRESTAEQTRNIKEIINGRTPSQAIVTLYDDLDAAKALLAIKEKQIEKLTNASEKTQGTHGDVKIKLLYITGLVCFSAGVVVSLLGLNWIG